MMLSAYLIRSPQNAPFPQIIPIPVSSSSPFPLSVFPPPWISFDPSSFHFVSFRSLPLSSLLSFQYPSYYLFRSTWNILKGFVSLKQNISIIFGILSFSTKVVKIATLHTLKTNLAFIIDTVIARLKFSRISWFLDTNNRGNHDVFLGSYMATVFSIY